MLPQLMMHKDLTALACNPPIAAAAAAWACNQCCNALQGHTSCIVGKPSSSTLLANVYNMQQVCPQLSVTHGVRGCVTAARSGGGKTCGCMFTCESC